MTKEEGVEGTHAIGAGSAGRAVLVPRPIGPGRVERAYQRRIAELEGAVSETASRCGAAQGQLAATESRLEASQGELRGLRGELETAGRLERGLQRHADKLEQRLETASQREKRLILALGSLQKENELLRERRALASAERAALLHASTGRAADPSPRPVRQTSARKRAKAERAGLLARLLRRGGSA